MNDTRRKRILIILSVLLIVLIATIIGLRFTNKDNSNISGKGGLVLSGEGTNDLSHPIGGGTPEEQTLGSNGIDAEKSKSAIRRFVQLSKTPVAGATFITGDDGLNIRYISKENGFIYDVNPHTLTTKQITNTTFIKGVEEAYWAEEGNTVLIRYADNDGVSHREIIKTYLGTIQNTSEGNGMLQKIVGLFLEDNISAVTVSPDGTKIFYLIPNADGVSGVLYDLATKKETAVFQNSFREWTIQFINNNELLFTTKPSSDIPGYSYRYTIKTGILTRFLREKNGLMVNSAPNGNFAVFSEKLLGKYYTNIWNKIGYTADEGVVLNEINLPFYTIEDKCAWPKQGNALYCGGFAPSNNSQLPDDWYQGAVTLADKFWKADRTTGETELIGDPELDLKSSFDSINPVVSPDEQSLVFVNKTDGILWLLNFIPYASPQEKKAPIDSGKDE